MNDKIFGKSWREIQDMQQGLHVKEYVTSCPVASIIGNWPKAPMWLGIERMDKDTPFPYVAEKMGVYLRSLGFPQHYPLAIKLLANAANWTYEDELPEMTDSAYAEWFAKSAIVDGVRMGPIP